MNFYEYLETTQSLSFNSFFGHSKMYDIIDYGFTELLAASLDLSYVRIIYAEILTVIFTTSYKATSTIFLETICYCIVQRIIS